MKRQLLFGGLALAAFQTVCLADTFIYNNGASNLADGVNISGLPNGGNPVRLSGADDFIFNNGVFLTGATFFASGDDVNFLADFSGTIGWAIFTDSGAQPNFLVASGSNSSPVLTDTGFQDAGTEEYRIDFTFGPGVALTAGTYWLALHEGAWGSAYDGTTIYWDTTSNQVGSLSQQSNDANGSAGTWAIALSNSDVAFGLSGINTPEPSSILFSAIGFGLLAFFARRKAIAAC